MFNNEMQIKRGEVDGNASPPQLKAPSKSASSLLPPVHPAQPTPSVLALALISTLMLTVTLMLTLTIAPTLTRTLVLILVLIVRACAS
mmetsp:Transcript_54532/g.108274  ORF Transcript_54532/g.108274 Transcript_54532/m.108274 type:complete len:88 (+) Transcript_54532:63-326(+)